MGEDSRDSQASPGWGVWALALALGVVLLGAIGLPVAGVITQLWHARQHPAPSTTETPVFVWVAVWRTFLYAGSIGVLATLLGLPAAWTLRRAAPWWIGLIAVPLLMPMYMVYAGWGMLRDPGSWLGDWLAAQKPWLTVEFDHARAVVGLALWAWPIAALVIGAEARRVPGHLLDALDLEPAAPVRKFAVVLRWLAGSMGVSIVLIAVLMAGSAVPLQLAQVDTYAIHLWTYLTLTAEPGSIWPAATPLLVMAGVVAWIVVRTIDRPQTVVRDEGDSEQRRVPVAIKLAAGLVWAASVLGPLVVLAMHLKRWSSVTEFWHAQGESVWLSVQNALGVGLFVAIIAIAVWAMRACRRAGGLPRLAAWVLIAAALIPGVLVGSAALGFWNAPYLPREAGNTPWPMVLTHVARFGFLGVLAGWWLAGLETPDERGARLMLAGDGVRGWAALCLRPHIAPVVGVGLAGLVLSLHEIEAAVILQPPGPTSLAQYVLAQLHYNRNEELCAACINLLGLGIVLAVGTGWLLGRARKA